MIEVAVSTGEWSRNKQFAAEGLDFENRFRAGGQGLGDLNNALCGDCFAPYRVKRAES